jgi:hypothetical protein
MSSSVIGSGDGPTYGSNFSSSPTDPELDPKAAEKALQALNDPQIGNIAAVMYEFYKSYNDGPPGGGVGGKYSLDNWNYCKDHPGVKPWWQTYEPIAGYDDNTPWCPFDNYDQNIVNAPTVKLWACLFGIKTGYSDPNTEGAGSSPGEYHHDPAFTVHDDHTKDSVSMMIQALKGKIDIIDSNILGVAGNPDQVQKLNALRCQIQVGLDSAVRLDNWRNQVEAWMTRAFGKGGCYDMLKPDKYQGDYYTGHISPTQGHFDTHADNANEREDYLYSVLASGPNSSDPFPRPPFDPFELAISCYNSLNSLNDPWNT